MRCIDSKQRLELTVSEVGTDKIALLYHMTAWSLQINGGKILLNKSKMNLPKTFQKLSHLNKDNLFTHVTTAEPICITTFKLMVGM